MSFITDKYGIYASGLLVQKNEPSKVDLRSRFADGSKAIADSLKDDASKKDDASQVRLAKAVDDNSQSSAGLSILLGAAQSVVSIGSSAISEIADLQQQQLDNATTAKNSVLNSKTTALQTQNSTIDTEISRIQSNAKYNGKNIFSELTSLSGPSEDGQSGFVVNIPNVASLQLTSSVTITNQTTAATAVIALTNALVSTDQLQSAFDSAQTKVSAAIEEASAIRADDPKVEQEVTVSDLVKKIANQIGSPFQNEYSKRSIIEAATKELDPDKAHELVA
jgi:hypothetical protein